jgi:prophage regulatory protein
MYSLVYLDREKYFRTHARFSVTNREAPDDPSEAATARPSSGPPERLLRIAEVSRRVGLGKSMIYELIAKERFPAPYKISACASRWSEQEIVAWIDKVKDGFEGKRRTFW